MSPSDNQLYYFIGCAVAFVAFGCIRKWSLWPGLKDQPPRTARTPLLLFASFLVNALIFLMTGIVLSKLSKAFTTPSAYGDFTEALLPLLAYLPVRATKNTLEFVSLANFLSGPSTGGIACAP